MEIKIKEIRERANLSTYAIAQRMKITQSAYTRIERGVTKIDLDRLEAFASAVNMSVIDVIAYPKKYVPIEGAVTTEPVEAILQIRLQREKKEQVLKLVFGENDIEILNK